MSFRGEKTVNICKFLKFREKNKQMGISMDNDLLKFKINAQAYDIDRKLAFTYFY